MGKKASSLFKRHRGLTPLLRKIRLITLLGMVVLPFTAHAVHAAPLSLQLQSDFGLPLTNTAVYAFTATNAYTGLNTVSDGSGIAVFNTDDFSDGTYLFRVDYLGYQFWTESVSIPATADITHTIPHKTTEVSVVSASGPVEGVPVYLFTNAGAYLTQNLTTDSSGKVSFNLPVGQHFRFRADMLGSQYWSDSLAIPDTGMAAATISAGGGQYRVTIKRDASQALDGVPIYLFTESNTYLNQNPVSNAAGEVIFDVPQGRYKVRADYLSGQYWSDVVEVVADLDQDLIIAHQEVTISATTSYGGDINPLAGAGSYLFNAAGSHLNISAATNSQGQVVFSLPQMDCRVRVDHLNRQYWSDIFSWNDAGIDIPLAEADVAVTGAGNPLADIPVFVFDTSGAYLNLTGTTDASGHVAFRLPAGDYRFRGDYQGDVYWSEDTALMANQTNPVSVSTGGGVFTLTLQKASGQPLEGLSCYLFTEAGTYVGLTSASASDGTVSFATASGNFKIRVDYMGYNFWTPAFSVPDTLVMTFDIPHRDCAVQVAGALSGDVENRSAVPVYLFSPQDAYLDQSLTTDGNGVAAFSLPDQPFKIRADYLGMSFWSEDFQYADTTVVIPEGYADVVVTGSGQPLGGVSVYAFNAAGAYLGLNSATDADGLVRFRLPAGDYRFRADYQGGQYWSDNTSLLAGQSNSVDLNCGGGEFALSLSDGSAAMEGVKIYVFNPAGTYLGMNAVSDANGEVRFPLADGNYRFRADYLGYQFWSTDFEVPATLNGAMTITHQVVQVTVVTDYPSASGLSDVPVYLFTEAGAYQGQTAPTDAGGTVSFNLPDKAYKVRADYRGSPYWSDPFQHQDTTLTIPHGELEVHVRSGDSDVSGAQVYVFGEAGSYLGLNAATGSDGRSGFVLPMANYKFRVDYSGEQHWSDVTTAAAGQSTTVDVQIAAFFVSISAAPAAIDAGQSATLTWNSTGAASCTLSPGIGDVALSGEIQVTPTATTEYTITATDGSASLTDSVTVVVNAVNTAPIITLIEPDGTDDTAEASFVIQWQDDDPEQNATIALYYDIDDYGADGTLIASGLMEDDDGAADSYTWDTSGLAEGNYFIYAVIDDGVAAPVVQYSTGPLTIGPVASVLEKVLIEPFELFEEGSFGTAVDMADGYAIIGATSLWEEPGYEVSPYEGAGSLGSAVIYEHQAGQWVPVYKLTNKGAFRPEQNPTQFLEVQIDGLIPRRRIVSNQPVYLNNSRVHDPYNLHYYVPYLKLFKDPCSGGVKITAIDFLIDGQWVSAEGAYGYHYDMFRADNAWNWIGDTSYAIFGGIHSDYRGVRIDAFRLAYEFTSPDVPSCYIDLLASGDCYTGDSWAFDGDTYIYDWDEKEHPIVDDQGCYDDGQDIYTNGTSYSEAHMWEGILSSVAAANDSFGFDVAMDGNVVVVGAPGESRSFNTLGAGAVHVYERVGRRWVAAGKLTLPDAAESDMLGYAVAVSGDTIVAGAPGRFEQDEGSGAVYVFKKIGGQWQQQAMLTPGDGQAWDWFGISVAIDGNRIIVGASQEPTGEPGKAYIYAFNGAVWQLESQINAPAGGWEDGFGSAVDIDGNTAAVGAPGADEASANLEDVGIAYVYHYVDGQWERQADLTLNNTQAEDRAGYDLALTDGILLVGTKKRNNREPLAGLAQTFKHTGDTWSFIEELTESDGNDRIKFGTAVAVDDGKFLIGAPEFGTDNSGAAFLYTPPETSAFIEASPQLFSGEGGEVTLQWNTTHADTVTIEPGIGSVAPSGTQVVTVTATTTFTISATGTYGEDAWSTEVVVNTPPSVSVTAPAGSGNLVDRKYTIEWEDHDADDNAAIALFYTGQNFGEFGTLIAEGIAEDDDGTGGSHVWDTSGLEEGDYYVYAVIDDGVNAPQISYSSGTISVSHALADVSGYAAVSGATTYSLALKGDGTVWMWGDDVPVGDGSTIQSLMPSEVPGLQNITAIGSGLAPTRAVRSDGTLWVWGVNDRGQLGLGDTVDTYIPTQVADMYGVATAATGRFHTLALKSDGSVWASGDNANGQLGDATMTPSSSFVSVWGLDDVTQVAAGWLHSLALKSDGTVWAWGSGLNGQVGHGTNVSGQLVPAPVTGLKDVTAIACGAYFSAAVKSDGTLWAWGSNAEGQLGMTAGGNVNVPVQVPIDNVLRIACGWNHMVALKYDGTVWTWGDNSEGQLGGYRVSDYWTPTQITELSNVVKVSAGDFTSIAVGADGSIHTLGDNASGQLGDGTTADRREPVPVRDAGGDFVLFPVDATAPSLAAVVAPETINEGESATLTWSTQDVDTLSITPEVGAVALNDAVTVTPAATTTYILTAANANGTTTKALTVAVVPKPVISFGVSPGVIDEGQSAMLSWSVQHADTVQIEPGIGGVNLSGNISVSPSEITTYTLTAIGPAGVSRASATLNVRLQRQTVIQYEYDELGRIRRKTFTNQ